MKNFLNLVLVCTVIFSSNSSFAFSYVMMTLIGANDNELHEASSTDAVAALVLVVGGDVAVFYEAAAGLMLTRASFKSFLNSKKREIDEYESSGFMSAELSEVVARVMSAYPLMSQEDVLNRISELSQQDF